MATRWEQDLDRWVANGVIDSAAADRIRAFEAKRAAAAGLTWPVRIAIAFGGLLLAAGALLFVAAHWDALSPAVRFTLVFFVVALFHVAAAVTASHFAMLAAALHAVGTVCLGAGIFLAGQIFNLQEHWPAGLMLWAIGAGIGFALLRDWPQAGLLALLVPAWLAGEWTEATRHFGFSEKPLVQGLLLLSVTYLTASMPGKDSSLRNTLVVIGALEILSFAAWTGIEMDRTWHRAAIPAALQLSGWLTAFALPLLLAWRLRGAAVRWNILAALWVVVLGSTAMAASYPSKLGQFWRELGPYFLWSVGAIGLTAWGLREGRKERVNLGIAGFALTVIAFYFSTVMDKLGRAASLIGMGMLFLVGGWLLEKTRRRLLRRLERDRT
mgnify:CR=1 FL=1